MNTVKNGKGDKPRQIDWKKYRDSEVWDNMRKAREAKKTSQDISKPNK